LTVTGSAELSYVQRDSGEITGNPIGMNKNIAFAGSGELDNGWTVSISQGTNDAMGFSSASVSIGMGSLGTLTFDGGTGADIGNALDNVMPTAFEEADAGMATGLVDSGGVIANHGSVKWAAPEMSGAKIYVGYTPQGGSGASADGATSEGVGQQAFELGIDFSPEMIPGLRVGGVIGEHEDGGGQGDKDLEEETYFATYAYGPLTIGYQVAEEDNGTTSYDTDIYGVSFNVNDALSVSYQYGETDGYAGGVTAEFTGISAAYNIGPMAIKFTDNSGKNINGLNDNSVAQDDDNRELNLSMSF
jgi:hypothetical protein